MRRIPQNRGQGDREQRGTQWQHESRDRFRQGQRILGGFHERRQGGSVKLELKAISSAGSAARAKRRIGTPRKSVATGYSRVITSSVRDLQISDVTATTTAFVVKARLTGQSGVWFQ